MQRDHPHYVVVALHRDMSYTLEQEIVAAGQMLLMTSGYSPLMSRRRSGWRDICFLFPLNHPLCLFEVVSALTIGAYILQMRTTFRPQTMLLIIAAFLLSFAVPFLVLQECIATLVLVLMNLIQKISPRRSHVTNLCTALKVLLTQLELENVLQAFIVPSGIK
jgi:hypothetical protein